MELSENYCLICKKYTSVLSNRDSNLYFRLLHKYLYAENLSDLEFKQIYIERQLCTQCAFNIDTVSTFINNIIMKDFHSKVSDVKCSFCQEECDCIYTSKNITEDFHQTVLLFLRKVLKTVNYDQSWQICLRCSFSVTTWNDIKEFIQNGVKNDVHNVEKTCSNKGRSKNGRKFAFKKSNVDIQKTVNVSNDIDEICPSDDNLSQKEIISNNICEISDISSDKENISKKTKRISNSEQNILDLTLPTIIKNKFNNIVIKTHTNKKLKRSTINEQLAHIKTISDITLHDYSILTQVIASNKQLMIEKPYVKLKKLDIEKYSCKDCRKIFSSNSSALLHEFSHYLRLTANSEQNYLVQQNNGIPNTFNLNVQNNISGKVTSTRTGCINIDFTDENNEKTTNTSKIVQNSSEIGCDLANICEIVYSDDETNKSNDIIVIDSDNEDSLSVPNISNKEQNYFKPNNQTLLNSINQNYQCMFNSFVLNQREKFVHLRTKTPTLFNLLNENNSSSVNEEKIPKIRVRNDLF